MSTTADLILALRRVPLSQTEIAKRTGIPQPRLSRWEGGKSAKGANDVLKLYALHVELIGPVPAQQKKRKSARPAKAAA